MPDRVDPSAAEALLLARGFAPSVPYTGSKVPWLGVCLRCGQPGKPRYNTVQQGAGPCRYCARVAVDTAVAEGRLLAKDFAVTVPFPGALKPWPGYCLRCGQPGAPRYIGNEAQGGCLYCAGNKVDTAIAVGKMMARDFLPSVSFPGAHKKWPGLCLKCGEGSSATYTGVSSGHEPCGYCSGKLVRVDIAVGKMMAKDFLPSTPYVDSQSPWPGVCLKCGQPGKPRYAGVVIGDQGPCAYCAGREVDTDIVRGKLLARDFVPSVPFPGVMKKWPGVCLRCGRHASPKYNSVQQGRGACVWCAGKVEADVAEAVMSARNFVPSVPFPGAQGKWKGVCLTCHHAGEATYTSVKAGVRPCSYCSGKREDPAIRVGRMLARDFAPSVPYPGAMKPWPGVCLRCGYPSSPTYQSIKFGNGACAWCSQLRIDPHLALGKMMAADFLPYGPFPGSRTPWAGECLKCGARGAPRFNAVDFGQGACRECSSSGFHPEQPGYFYVVTDGSVIKGGISNTAARVNRVRTHARQGLTDVLFVIYFSRGHDAEALEQLWIEHLGTLEDHLRVDQDVLEDGYTEAAIISDDTDAFLVDLLELGRHFAEEVRQMHLGVSVRDQSRPRTNLGVPTAPTWIPGV